MWPTKLRTAASHPKKDMASYAMAVDTFNVEEGGPFEEENRPQIDGKFGIFMNKVSDCALHVKKK